MLFILFNLKNHKLIFGQTFFAYFNIAINIARHQLFWPENLKPHYSAICTKDLSQQNLLLEHLRPLDPEPSY